MRTLWFTQSMILLGKAVLAAKVIEVAFAIARRLNQLPARQTNHKDDALPECAVCGKRHQYYEYMVTDVSGHTIRSVVDERILNCGHTLAEHIMKGGRWFL